RVLPRRRHRLGSSHETHLTRCHHSPHLGGTSLFDPLAAVLLVSGKRQGTDLACAIMTTDLSANWYATYGIQHSTLSEQPGLQRLIAFAVLVLGTAPFIRRRLTN
ncbi:hypothetical protein AB0N06_38620, partial [Streptomyces sp. NPDC051020]